MNKGFNAVFDAMQAWNNIVILIIGFILLAIGAALIAYDLYWRFTGTRVPGHVAAVRAVGISAVRAVGVSTVPASGISTADTAPAPVSLDTPDPTAKPKVNFAQEFRKHPGTGAAAMLIALLFLGMPLTITGIGVWTACDYLMLVSHGVATDGKVLTNNYTTGSKGGRSYHAVVTFKDQGGAEHTLKDKISMGHSPSYSDGSSVEVHYDPANPAHGAIGSFSHNMTVSMIFMGFGGIFLLAIWHAPRAQQKALLRQRQLAVAPFRGEMYYAVYEYTDINGNAVQAETGSGSNWIGDKVPSTEADLYVRPDNPGQVTKSGFLCLVFGVVFFAPGAALLVTTLSRMSFNIFTWGILALLVAQAAYKIKKSIKPPGQRQTPEEFRARQTERHRDGRLLTPEEIRDRLRVQDHQSGGATPFVGLIAAVLIVGGLYLCHDIQQLTENGVSAPGKILRVELVYGSSHGGAAYYPVAGFEAGSSAPGKSGPIEFRDSFGSNPAAYTAGDPVTVLYDPADPHHAVIDRGFWNWLPGGACLTAGGLLLLLAFRVHTGVVRRRAFLDT